MDRVRVIRVLEYSGPRDWIETSLQKRVIKGIKIVNDMCSIREAILGDFPEVVEEEKKTRVVEQLTSGEIRFMKRFGWDLEIKPATKHDIQTGKVLAHEGDETWTRDLKVAGE